MANLIPTNLANLIPSSVLAAAATNTAIVAIVASAVANGQTDAAAISSIAQLPAIQSIINANGAASVVNSVLAGTSRATSRAASGTASGTAVVGTRTSSAAAAATSARSAANAGSPFSVQLGLAAFCVAAGVLGGIVL